MIDILDVWAKTLAVLQEELSSVSFNTWVKPLTAIKIEDHCLYLQTDESFAKNIIESRHLNLIQNALREVSKTNLSVQIVLPSDATTETDSSFVQPKSTISEVYGNLNPKYIFDKFVIGNSNRMAHAAALAVAESPGITTYNPLFLYGGVGLGKTHLMHSIAHFILTSKPNAKVLYVSSEKFTNELINSIRYNKNEAFRKKYRQVDVLLIDDVQFLSEKERTQEEFFHTFNELHGENKQIILSSDRPPKDIKTLEERLRSRFECGLMADIQTPDFETRIAILMKKAHSEQKNVPNDVFAFIAKNFASNIRELEGALIRVAAYAELANQPITLSLTEEALKDLIYEFSEKTINTELIQEIVANFYSVSVEELRGKKRTKHIAHCRQIAMYLCRKILDISLAQIGDSFGGRDHSTVIHGADKIQFDIEKDSSLRKALVELENKIRGV